MADLLILAPAPIALISASRGADVANLLTADPREVWADSAVGTSATLDIDFGNERTIDTLFLGHVLMPLAGATWAITGGTSSYTGSTLLGTTNLRVPDVGGIVAPPSLSHALWRGAPSVVRYLRITITQPAEGQPLTAGVLMAGRAFSSALNHEWGAGRRPIDTSSVTPLPAGGFSVVEGARKSAWTWSFGDLTDAELDALYEITLYRGEGKPVLVVEDPDRSAGLRRRIHYGLFRQLRTYERLSRGRTRWEMTVEDWGADEASAL